MIYVFSLPFSVTCIRPSSDSSLSIADDAKKSEAPPKSQRTQNNPKPNASQMSADIPRQPAEKMAHGRTDEGFSVPPGGGYVEQEDAWGRRELWLGWTNYPAPYWNEWHLIRERLDEDEVDDPVQLWWYGEWS